MINLYTDKKLNILLPSTNKALAEVLKDATPKELEAINQGKDLKSIMNSLLKQSSQNSSADKVLLELVKNNPTLKQLETPIQNIKELLSSLKQDEKLQHVEQLLQKFLPDMKGIKSLNIKQIFENSGVFLESKLKDIKDPRQKLNQLVSQLSNELSKSKLAVSKELNTQVKELVNSATTKEIQTVLNKFSTELKLANQTTKLEHLSLPQNIEKNSIKSSNILDVLKPIKEVLEQTFTKDSKLLLESVNKVIKSLEESLLQTKKMPIEKKVLDEIKTFIVDIKTSIKKDDSLFSKNVQVKLNELSSLKLVIKQSPEQQIKELLSNDLKSVLSQVSQEVSKSNLPNSMEVLKQVDKLALQIDYYQLVSHLSNASSLYIPFSWEQMQEGDVTIQHSKNDTFYCDIDLKLKDFGELNIRMTLYEQNQLNLHISSDSQEFKEIVKENIQTLRQALVEVQITPREIRLFDKMKTISQPYEDNSMHLDAGFEVVG